jgi:hypothetical protein
MSINMGTRSSESLNGAFVFEPALSVRRGTFPLSLTISYTIIALCLGGCETDTVSRFAFGQSDTEIKKKVTDCGERDAEEFVEPDNSSCSRTFQRVKAERE